MTAHGEVACARHQDRIGEYALAMAYINSGRWQDVMKPEQTFGPFCSECRSESIEWACRPAPPGGTADRGGAVWIEQRPQRQDSLADQLRDLHIAASRLGMYDAADWLWKTARIGGDR